MMASKREDLPHVYSLLHDDETGSEQRRSRIRRGNPHSHFDGSKPRDKLFSSTTKTAQSAKKPPRSLLLASSQGLPKRHTGGMHLKRFSQAEEKHAEAGLSNSYGNRDRERQSHVQSRPTTNDAQSLVSRRQSHTKPPHFKKSAEEHQEGARRMTKGNFRAQPFGQKGKSSSHISQQVGKPKRAQATEKERWNIQPMSMSELKFLCKLTDSSELVNQLHSRLKSFQETLQSSKMLGDTTVVDAIVYILLKVSECLGSTETPHSQFSQMHSRACQILGEVLSTRCAEFQVRLAIYIKRDLVGGSIGSIRPLISQRQHPPVIPSSYCSPLAKATTVCRLFTSLLETIPESSWSVLPVDELATSIQSSTNFQDLQSEVEPVVILRNEIRDQLQRAPVTDKVEVKNDDYWDNSEYREQQILPQWEDVCISDRPPRLRPNIISGSYTDWMHYYDIQFRLLREDFIAPLRQGICEYRQGVRGRKLQDVKVYQNVKFCEPLFSTQGVCYDIQFDASRMQNYQWEHSKRLLFGSLLCLSPDDNFTDTILFATVANRDPKDLRKGKLQVRFEEDSTKMLAYCKLATTFTMIESLAYFEASRHILHSLQIAEVATMPFTRYLVQNQCDVVSVPKYLEDERCANYNLSCLLKGSSVSTRRLSTSSSKFGRQVTPHFNIKDMSQWPTTVHVELDDSQLKAIQMALTQEVAVIQGPPGTGKTYIGLKIVEALLQNRVRWDPDRVSPIVIVCLTNHALDQFLEGILKQSVNIPNGTTNLDSIPNLPKLVRVGCRSRSELIQHFSINEVRKNLRVPSHIYKQRKACDSAVTDASKSIPLCLRRYFGAKKRHDRSILFSHGELDSRISQKHFYQLFERLELQEEYDRALELWLGIYEMYEEDVLIEQESTSATGMITDYVPYQNPVNNRSNSQINSERIGDSSDHEISSSKEQEETGVNAKPTGTEPYCEDTVQDDGESEEEEELIDVEGEAAIEQGARMMEDDIFEPYHLQQSDLKDEYFHGNEQEPANGFRHSDDKLESTALKSDIADENVVTGFFSDPSNALGLIEADLDSNTYLDDFAHNELGDKHEENGKAKMIQTSHYERVRCVAPRRDAYHILKRGHRQNPMLPEEANNVDCIHDIAHNDRWRLYNYWASEYLKHLIELNEAEFKRYDRLCQARLEARRATDRFALETAEVIGMTTTGAAKYQHILHLVKPRIVIVEEAAEVMESHIVSALNAGTQHLILIGDHKQLRPKPNDYTLAKKYHLDISLFERLVRNNFPHATLQIQHRMRPEIAQLVKPHIYETLVNHPSVETYGAVIGVEKNIFFIQHEQLETDDENLLSHSNQHEAKYLVALCKYLLQQGYTTDQITILVTYSGQLLKMRDHMPKKDFEGIRVCTVDNFQGEENDIILLSLVRSNKRGITGFLKEENRVCVALSRAKMGFYCIGNFRMLRDNAMIWGKIMTDVEQNGHLSDCLPLGCAKHPSTKFTAKIPEDFAKNAPEGGCLQDCMERLTCGHVCTLKCHNYDHQHERYKCKKPCQKTCPEGHSCPLKCYVKCNPCRVYVNKTIPLCGHTQRMKCHEKPDVCYSPCENKCNKGHPCMKRCSDECGDCEVRVDKTIPECGHVVKLSCYKSPVHSECTEPCEKLLPCGHWCMQSCGKECNPKSCKVLVNVKLNCGHEMKVPCNNSALPIECDLPCERKLVPCGHPCREKCSQPCTKQCQVHVNKVWPCGHKMKRRCYQTQNPHKYPCEKLCKEKLACGHHCPGKCGEDCTEYKCEIVTQKTLSCGHTQKVPCYTSKDPSCKIRCPRILACGHRCEGNCSQCSSTRLHKPCRYGVEMKQFCGHKSQVQCLDMTDTRLIEQKQCVAYCPHKKCSETHDCSTLCTPCTEPCAWNCPHHQCTKLCHELCDRPQCNERCENRLKCGHRCYGLCGEPCLTFCPLCRRREFNKRFKERRGFDPAKLYVQLDCSHISTVDFMDLSTRRDSAQAYLVTPLQCHSCGHSLCSSYRYGNAVKQSLQDVNAVRDIITTTKQTSVSRGDIQDIRKRLENVLKTDMLKITSEEINRHIRTLEPKTHTYSSFCKKLEQHGFYSSSQKLGYAARYGHCWFLYQPLSHTRITEDVKKLQRDSTVRISNQELFVLHFLINTLELLSICAAENLESISLNESLCTQDVKKQLASYVSFLFSLKKNNGSRLSVQLVRDLQSEMYRICLVVQYCLVKKVEIDAFSTPLDSVIFLRQCSRKTSQGVQRSDFDKHSSAFAQCYEKIKSEPFPASIREFTCCASPPVLKGSWWKCSKGHYYCSPISMGRGVEASCPHCDS